MEVYGLLMVSVLTIALGLASLFQNARDDTVRFFVGTLVGTSLWAFGIAVFLSTSSSSVAVFAAALYYSAAALIGLATALMGLSVGRERILPWRKVLALSIPPAVITVILFCFPEILFQKVIIEPNVAHTIELASFPYIIYGIFFMTYLLIGVTGMLRQMHRVRHQRRAFMRLVYVTSAYSIAGVIGVWFNLILPGFGEYTYIWIGPLGLLAFLPVVYVAIIRYGLFDIRAAVLRAVTYGLVLVALAGHELTHSNRQRGVVDVSRSTKLIERLERFERDLSEFTAPLHKKAAVGFINEKRGILSAQCVLNKLR